MTGNNFTDDDKQKVIDFLNTVAKTAKFEVDTIQLIEYFKLLSYMQSVIIPKINSHVLEVIKITEAPEAKDGPTENGE